MADTKISALTASTTPLAGTEVLPIVQNGETKQVSVANLTAGRAISATQLTLTTENLVIGTAGKGIDFSANPSAAGMTSELLDDYEEGTFTPTIVGTTTTGAGTYTEQNGYYTKIGNRVFVNITLAWSAHTGTGNMRVSGLPFANENVTGNISMPSFWVADLALTAGNVIQGFVNTGSTQILLYQVPTGGGSSSFVPIDTAATLRVSLQYQTAS